MTGTSHSPLPQCPFDSGSVKKYTELKQAFSTLCQPSGYLTLLTLWSWVALCRRQTFPSLLLVGCPSVLHYECYGFPRIQRAYSNEMLLFMLHAALVQKA